jgi:hypothetical protein
MAVAGAISSAVIGTISLSASVPAACSDGVGGSSETHGSIPRPQQAGTTLGACNPVPELLRGAVVRSDPLNAMSRLERSVGATGDIDITCHTPANDVETAQVSWRYAWQRCQDRLERNGLITALLRPARLWG